MAAKAGENDKFRRCLRQRRTLLMYCISTYTVI